MILNLRAFWDSQRVQPFMNETIPIIDIENLTLANFIRREIVNHRPSIKYNDYDIKSIKSGSGSNKTRILQYPASSCIESIQNETPFELNVVIERPIQQPAAAAAAAAATPTPFERLMNASKPTVNSYNSSWEVSDVTTFQVGYENAINKEEYLKTLPADKKPTIDEQYEAYTVQFLNDSKLGYKGGSGGEEMVAKKALKLTAASLKFVSGYRNIMGRSRVTMYDSSSLLRNTKGCVSSKAKKVKATKLTKDMVMHQIEKVDECRAAFPSSYYRKVGNGSRYGEPILKEIEIWKDIIGKHYQDMLKQDMRNKESTTKDNSKGPTNFNTTHSVIPPKM